MSKYTDNFVGAIVVEIVCYLLMDRIFQRVPLELMSLVEHYQQQQQQQPYVQGAA